MVVFLSGIFRRVERPAEPQIGSETVETEHILEIGMRV